LRVKRKAKDQSKTVISKYPNMAENFFDVGERIETLLFQLKLQTDLIQENWLKLTSCSSAPE